MLFCREDCANQVEAGQNGVCESSRVMRSSLEEVRQSDFSPNKGEGPEQKSRRRSAFSGDLDPERILWGPWSVILHQKTISSF